MVQKHERILICSLLACLSVSLGCGDKSDGGGAAATGGGGASASGGTSGSGGMSASGKGGSGGTMAGSGGTAGTKEPTPPPEMPRELGPPDGIYCASEVGVPPPFTTCPAGSRCCPYFDRDSDLCVGDGGKCPACGHVTCGQLVCDGPEDCSGGQFCCYAESDCASNPDDCTPEYPNNEDSYWNSVECRARCVGDQGDPDHGIVVCKDDRDCPGPYVVGRCQPLDTGLIPQGLKVCSGG